MINEGRMLCETVEALEQKRQPVPQPVPGERSYSRGTSHANNDSSVNFLPPTTVSDLNFSEVCE